MAEQSFFKVNLLIISTRINKYSELGFKTSLCHSLCIEIEADKTEN